MTEHTTKTNRHTTFYPAAGPKDGPLIIFVHGWSELSISWCHQLPALATLGFRAIAPDMAAMVGHPSTLSQQQLGENARFGRDTIGAVRWYRILPVTIQIDAKASPTCACRTAVNADLILTHLVASSPKSS